MKKDFLLKTSLLLLTALLLNNCSNGDSGTNTPPKTEFDLEASTIGLWHFNDLSGQTVSDDSGNGYALYRGSTSAAETADPNWFSDSQWGGIMNFDTDLDYCYSAVSPIPTGSFTAEFILRGDTANSTYCDFFWLGFMQCSIKYDWDSHLQFNVGNMTSWSGDLVVSDDSSWDGEWHYIACTYAGSTMKIYIDGTLAASRSDQTWTIGNVEAIWIGGRSSNTSFYGDIAEARLSGTAKSAADISAVFQSFSLLN